MSRPNMRYVRVKTAVQQGIQASELMGHRTATANHDNADLLRRGELAAGFKTDILDRLLGI